jgi:hypothetical protein
LSLLLKYLPIVSVEAFTTRSTALPNSVGVLSDRCRLCGRARHLILDPLCPIRV